jgi:5-methyltetrahydrofolate--homocysteine methyltransferase
VIIIAERINSSRKSIAQAIEARDVEFIRSEATRQEDAGAHYIDVNAGSMVGKEIECLNWLVDTVQDVTDLPLCIDSPDPHVIKTILPKARATPMINSVTLDPDRLDVVLPLAADHNAKLIALCQSPDILAETADQKVELASKLVEKATIAGVPISNLYIDPLVYPLSTCPQSGEATLEAVERIMDMYPNVHTVCGLTNVSYGLPNRKLVNRTFLVACICRGLDATIMDPTDKQLYGAMKAATMVMGQDDYCMDFVTAHREGRLE